VPIPWPAPAKAASSRFRKGTTPLNAAEQENRTARISRTGRSGSRQPTSGEIDAAEAGNPESVDFKDRMISNHKTTNDELNAGETGNPHAVENASP